jgi:16S rRNA (uracil1498-N3)-methyltransferase
VTVLRLGPGDPLEVFDGEGGRYEAMLQPDLSLQVGPRREEAARRTLVLAQGLAKGDKMDFIVQKATELGASAVALVAAERSVVRLDEARAAARVARLQRIAEAAARQCGRADVPRVLPPATLVEVSARSRAEGAVVLVLHEQAQGCGLAAAAARAAGPIVLAVGPEGGFTDEEILAARGAGAEGVTLGRRVLRAETAAVVGLAVVALVVGELG